ncbi:hypothetical protein X777_15143 [Ooceraea biroi]|uniref:Uncharacterized protein n=1 Tax=Ooceraea biroi TaxID=2015173 RepID=A0A026VY79_OOCBI|nr:hypothetical protein X777_15143 [Ooceraea biroi]
MLILSAPNVEAEAISASEADAMADAVSEAARKRPRGIGKQVSRLASTQTELR